MRATSKLTAKKSELKLVRFFYFQLKIIFFGELVRISYLNLQRLQLSQI